MQVTQYSDDVIQTQRTHDGTKHQSLMILICTQFVPLMFLLNNEQTLDHFLSYDVAAGSEIMPSNKICKLLVVYRFSGNVMTSITTLRK